jgi:ELWxxDGT repeat protein
MDRMLFRHRFAVRQQNPLNCRKLGLETLESRQLLAGDFHLFKDINATPAPVGMDGNWAGGFAATAVVGGTYYFSAVDGVHGEELWKSDGTEAGTVLVKDIRPGGGDSTPAFFRELNGVLYFRANDGVHGGELWRSDGTEAGTYMVRDVLAGEASAYPWKLHQVGGKLFFEAFPGHQEGLLWSSDGTEAGTSPFEIGGEYSYPTIVAQNSTSLFVDVMGDLWRTDGTPEGTVRLFEGGNEIQPIATIGETLYFTHSSWSVESLWKTDGTAAGTQFVAHVDALDPLYWDYLPVGIGIGETMLFPGFDAEHGSELWRTDGTESGTFLVKDISPDYHSSTDYPISSRPGNFANFDGKVYFFALDEEGHDLWKTDGTSEGTVLVKEFSSAPVTAATYSLANIDGVLFFSLKDGNGTALWKSDGTEAGTVKVKAVNDGNVRLATTTPTKVGDSILFFADDQQYGMELWRSDGTEAGTGLVKDIRVASGNSNPSQFTEVGRFTYFIANDGVTGDELWISDGSSAGTRRVKDIRPGPESPQIAGLTNVDGTLYFIVAEELRMALWKSDGTEEGTSMIRKFANYYGDMTPESLVSFQGKLYFEANDGELGSELWTSDGTADGTFMVKDVNEGWLPGGFESSVVVGETLFFYANDGVHGSELWKSDGTEAGTTLVKDVNPGMTGTWWRESIEFNGELYLVGHHPDTGGELWKSDGTAAGTHVVKDIQPGAYSSSPYDLTNANGTLYFSVFRELWKTDGTEAGTQKVKDFGFPGALGHIQIVATPGSLVYFFAAANADDFQFWVSDGTTEGTIPIASAGYPTVELYRIESFLAWNGYLYFAGADETNGGELWRTDGTVAGTELVQDFSDTVVGGVYGENRLVVMNNRLLVIATTVDHGVELWISAPEDPGKTGDYDGSDIVDGADFLAWQRGFGGVVAPAGSGADGDGNGMVDAEDLAVWAEHFGEGSSSGVVAADAAVSAAVEMTEVEEFAAVSLAAVEGAVAVDEFFAKPRAASSRSLIALAQGTFGIEDARERRAAVKAIVRLDNAEEIPHARSKSASSRDAAFAALAGWPLAPRSGAHSAGQLERGEGFGELSALLDSSLSLP